MNPSSLSSKLFGSQWATRQFEQDHGDGLESLGDTAAFDYWHLPSSARVELKSSRPTKDGHYAFQYIHPERFDVGVFLGYRPDSVPHYWVIPSGDLPRFLSIQHRDRASYQMRVSPASPMLGHFRTSPEHLATLLSRVCRSAVRSRRRVALAPAFESLAGWWEVVERLERRLKREFDRRWQIRIRVAPPDDEGLVPYPTFASREFRMDSFAHPEPIIGSSDISYAVSSILDFLLFHEFPDDLFDLNEDV
jgi:hypothetical protein